MQTGRPRIAVAMSTRHQGIAVVARALRDEGLLKRFLVPFDATPMDRILGRLLPEAHVFRRPLRQWQNEPEGRSAAALQELAVSAAYRLPRTVRDQISPQRLVRWRQRTMARATRRALMDERVDATIFLQPEALELGLDRAPLPRTWLFAMSDEWDLEESLSRQAREMPAGPLKTEIESENPGAGVRRIELALAHVAAVITESTRMASLVGRFVAPGTPVFSIGQGVDCDVYRPGGTRNFEARPVRVAQLSRIVHGKGLLVAERARALAGGAVESWRVAGWESELSPVLTRSVLNLDLLAPLPLREAVRELQQADVFVLPTLGDSMPRAVLEAMAAGLPVITTDRAGYDDVIVDGENGFIVPVLDAEAIAPLLVRLSDDGDLRRRVGLAARTTAEKNTWEAVGRRFLEGFRSELLPSLGQA